MFVEKQSISQFSFEDDIALGNIIVDYEFVAIQKMLLFFLKAVVSWLLHLFLKIKMLVF